MTQLFLFFQLHGQEILQAVTGVISGASVLANFTRTDKDNKALGAIGKAINFFAANFFVLKSGPPKFNK
jgi:cellobiose-specific phosphotransferase system component IIC